MIGELGEMSVFYAAVTTNLILHKCSIYLNRIIRCNQYFAKPSLFHRIVVFPVQETFHCCFDPFFFHHRFKLIKCIIMYMCSHFCLSLYNHLSYPLHILAYCTNPSRILIPSTTRYRGAIPRRHSP